MKKLIMCAVVLLHLNSKAQSLITFSDSLLPVNKTVTNYSMLVRDASGSMVMYFNKNGDLKLTVIDSLKAIMILKDQLLKEYQPRQILSQLTIDDMGVITSDSHTEWIKQSGIYSTPAKKKKYNGRKTFLQRPHY